MDKALEEFRQQENKVLEILKGRPKYVARENVETKLSAPYPSGVVWHYGPIDQRITKLIENKLQDYYSFIFILVNENNL